MLETFSIPVTELHHYHRNPRHGDVGAISESLKQNGQYRAIVVNKGTHTGRPMEVLAGNHTLKAAKALGWSEIAAHIIDVDDEKAAQIVLADNRTNDLATNDTHVLIELLESLDDLRGTGYDSDDLSSLLHEVEEYEHDRASEYEQGAAITPTKRTISLDAIYSSQDLLGPAQALSWALGWRPGCITTAARIAQKYVETFPRRRILFMDNEWHGYNHEEHVNVLSQFNPKYATVRDLVTKSQAQENDVQYYTISETLEMAEEISQYCEKVILIPKYDCLDQLPQTINGKPVVLGYSVESSYGGTELPPTAFQGWPVHLLGGAWKKQRAILNLLGDDVVSFDNNNLLKIAQFSQVNMPNGTTRTLDEVINKTDNLTYNPGSHMHMAACLSLANIMHALRTDFGVTMNKEMETDE